MICTAHVELELITWDQESHALLADWPGTHTDHNFRNGADFLSLPKGTTHFLDKALSNQWSLC